MKNSLEIYCADTNPERRRVLAEFLRTLGHTIGLETRSGRELIGAVAKGAPSLIIASLELSEQSAIDSLLKCADFDPVPAIIIAEDAELEKVEEALKDHVMAYLVDPVDMNDLRTTIHLVVRRFEQFQELWRENKDLKEALERRKWVERAKGVLMREHSLEEEAAYARLRKIANDRRKNIGEVAQVLVEAADMLKN